MQGLGLEAGGLVGGCGQGRKGGGGGGEEAELSDVPPRDGSSTTTQGCIQADPIHSQVPDPHGTNPNTHTDPIRSAPAESRAADTSAQQTVGSWVIEGCGTGAGGCRWDGGSSAECERGCAHAS